MKIYKFVGDGMGVPGLSHTIKKSEGDQMISDFERALRVEKAEKGIIDGPYQAQQMPGAILKGALANGNYKALSTKDKPSSGKPSEEKEKE